jgi:hypothetical protein
MKTPCVVVLSMTILVLALSGPPGASADADDPPDSVNLDTLQQLYEPVVFDHAMHLDIASCSVCHHHTTGEEPVDPSCLRCHSHPEPAAEVACSSCHLQNWQQAQDSGDGSGNDRYHIDIPHLQGALHLRCLGCHEKDGGPTGCQDCHAFTDAGRKRFFVASSSVESIHKPEGGTHQ